MSTNLSGHFSTTTSGRASYEIANARPEFLAKIIVVLRSQFGFNTLSDALIGLDHVSIDASNGETTLIVGWDNWNGCFLQAQQPVGDEVVTAVGRYLDARLAALQTFDTT